MMRGQRTRAALISIASNAALIVLKLIAGAITGSVAIITEAIHSAVDLVASFIAYFSVRQAEEPADADHPHGHEKFENVAAAAEGVLILIGSGVIIYAAIRSLVLGPELHSLGVGIAVLAFATVVNLVRLDVAVPPGPRDAVGGAGGRRRAPAHRRLHLGRRARRARARADHGRRVAGSGGGAGDRGRDRRHRAADRRPRVGRAGRRGAARHRARRHPRGDRGLCRPRRRRLPPAAHPPRRRAPLCRPARPVRVRAPRSRTPTGRPTRCRTRSRGGCRGAPTC